MLQVSLHFNVTPIESELDLGVKWLCVFGGSVHNEAKPILYFGGGGGGGRREVLYSGHVGGRLTLIHQIQLASSIYLFSTSNSLPRREWECSITPIAMNQHFLL